MGPTSPVARIEDGLVLPEGAGVLTRLRLAIRALKILEKTPDDGIAAPLFNATIDSAVFEKWANTLSATDEGRTLLADRPSLEARHVDLEALGKLPEGTLGHAFAKYFADNGIHPFKSPYEVRNEVDFLVKWYRETHDLHHIVTGYGTDEVGEMELQAFAAGNLGLRTSLFILTFAAILQPRGLPPIWRYAAKLRAAFKRGKHARPLISVRYERLMTASVDAVKAELKMPPVDSGPA